MMPVSKKMRLYVLCNWWRRGRVELPVQKKVARTSTGVVGTLILPGLPLSTELNQASQLKLSQSPLASGLLHPGISSPNPNPPGRGQVGWCGLVRQQQELLLRQLFFCHLIYEVDGTSACRPVGFSLSKPRAPINMNFLKCSAGFFLQCPLNFTLGLTPGDGITLVEHPLAPAHTKF